MMTYKAALAASAGLLALVASSPAAWAAGFQIREQSGSSQGMSFANAATATDDISTMFFNPAGLAFHDGHQAVTVASGINPNAKFKGGSASTVVSSPISTAPGFSSNKDIGPPAFVPASYAMMSVTDDLKLGLAITAPFGLKTQNEEGWIGRYHALDSRLTTININPTVAYRVMPNLALGVGFVAQRTSAKLSQAIDFGTIGAALTVPGSLPGGQDGRAVIRGDDWGFGFTVGAMYEPIDSLRFGVSYRSQVKHTVKGKAEFDLGASGQGAAISGLTGAFVNTGISADATIPDVISMGVSYDVTDRWTISAEADWTDWSDFDELVIEFDNPAQSDSFTEESWHDSWFLAIGTSYDITDDLTIRGGFAYDQGASPTRTRTPRIPDEDRYWISVGATYEPFEWASVSLGYTHIFLPDAEINLAATDTGNTFRGNLSGEFEGSVDIIALQGKITF